MSLEGKVVLIAGGSGALGRTVVPAVALAGAQVITMDRHPLSGQVEGRQAMQADATDEADVQRLVADVLRRAGRIDVLVNLIGGFAMGRVVETDVAVWQRMLTMNLTAAFLLSKAVLPPMLTRRTGRIVHVAARAAVDPFPGAAAYVVSKAGLVALVRTLATEVAGSGVTVHGLLPNTIDTPANRSSMPEADPATWAKPESIAQALLFLAADEAGQFNGALIPVG